jgi:hypothetical protein
MSQKKFRNWLAISADVNAILARIINPEFA